MMNSSVPLYQCWPKKVYIYIYLVHVGSLLV